MKSLSILLIVTLAAVVGTPLALAQHVHGGGHMDMPDHTSQVGTSGHTTSGASLHNPSEQLMHNTALAGRLQPLLPGTNLQTAATGFKNLGQFVAAVHAAHNLKIPFDELKAKLTGPNAESLGHAIHDLDPNLSSQTVKSDTKTAERQAKQDLDEASEASEKGDH